MSLHRRGLYMQGAVGFVPLDADVLLNHAKLTPLNYQKINTTAWDGYAYRDINSVDNSEIRMSNSVVAAGNRMVGFYNKNLVDPATYKNFDYIIQVGVLGNFLVYERGILKFNAGNGTVSDNSVCRAKKITGSAEFYLDGVPLYISLQDFNGAEFGCMLFTINDIVENVYYKL